MNRILLSKDVAIAICKQYGIDHTQHAVAGVRLELPIGEAARIVIEILPTPTELQRAMEAL